MSKIYEALRQAELDREKNPQQTAARTANAVLDAPAGRPGPSAVPSQAGSSGLLTDAILPITTEDGATTMPATEIDRIKPAIGEVTVDLTGVRSYLWNPLLSQLPALEERGAGVEQFRSLRSRMYEFRALNTLKSVIVSSGIPEEGKSFVAVNLAIGLARHKSNRVLLIDGDMRRASLHKRLGTTQGPGLTEFLAGKATISEVMQQPKPFEDGHPLPPGIANLTFIPGGIEHAKAADLSGNSRFGHLMQAVAPFFDWIIVDSSPVNLVSDGVNLARSCDAALLVARAGVTKYEFAQRALNELKATRILGFVLNAVENPTVAMGYYGYDGYDKIEEDEEPAGTSTQ